MCINPHFQKDKAHSIRTEDDDTVLWVPASLQHEVHADAAIDSDDDRDPIPANPYSSASSGAHSRNLITLTLPSGRETSLPPPDDSILDAYDDGTFSVSFS